MPTLQRLKVGETAVGVGIVAAADQGAIDKDVCEAVELGRTCQAKG